MLDQINGICGLPFEVQVHIASYAKNVNLRSVDKTLYEVAERWLMEVNKEIADRADVESFQASLNPNLKQIKIFNHLILKVKTIAELLEPACLATYKPDFISEIENYNSLLFQLEQLYRQKAFEVLMLTAGAELGLIADQLTDIGFVWMRHVRHNLDKIVKLNFTLTNQLYQLHDKIGEFRALKTLSAVGNKIRRLPPAIGQLNQLTTLFLSNNRLKELSSEIGKLTALKNLDVEGNQLTTLPPEIGNLTSLLHLNVRNNRLVKLPAKMNKLASLSSLDIRKNPLTSLSPVVVCLPNLRFIYIDRVQDKLITTQTKKEMKGQVKIPENEVYC